MLFRKETWPGLADGSSTVAFRRWSRPTVKAGGRLRCPVGELAIESVDIISEDDITGEDARRAGFRGRDAAIKALDGSRVGTLYRVRFHLAGPDSRIALREQADFSPEDIEAIRVRLASFDRNREWAVATLRLIQQRPATLAARLAKDVGMETGPFKARVRKLKDLGLTESLPVGYRPSPRGEAFLRVEDEGA
jgi:hypothetical protein